MAKSERSTGRTELADSIDHLTEHVKVLWQAVDELRSDIQWAVQNGRVVVDAGADFAADGDTPSLPVDLTTVVHDLDAVTGRLRQVHGGLRSAIEQTQQTPGVVTSDVENEPQSLKQDDDNAPPPGRLF